MPRFSILCHDHPFPHWDLLLENGGSCLTWRLLEAPNAVAIEIPAEQSFNHRLIYLEYEGPIEGGRGSVVQWDCGTFEWTFQSRDAYEVLFSGLRYQGRVRLERTDGDRWSLIRIDSTGLPEFGSTGK